MLLETGTLVLGRHWVTPHPRRAGVSPPQLCGAWRGIEGTFFLPAPSCMTLLSRGVRTEKSNAAPSMRGAEPPPRTLSGSRPFGAHAPLQRPDRVQSPRSDCDLAWAERVVDLRLQSPKTVKIKRRWSGIPGTFSRQMQSLPNSYAKAFIELLPLSSAKPFLMLMFITLRGSRSVLKRVEALGS